MKNKEVFDKRNLLNFIIGFILGWIGLLMYRDSVFLYYFCFVPLAVSIYILINFSKKTKRC